MFELRLYIRTENCPNCEMLKKSASEKGIKIETGGILKVYDVDTVDGLAESAFDDVRAVPALVVDEDGETSLITEASEILNTMEREL